MVGFEKAALTVHGHSADARARADAPGAARTAMGRTDLSPEVRKELRAALVTLGNAIQDQRFDPNTSDAFREQLRKLATLSQNSQDFKDTLAHFRAARHVLDQVELAPGTRLAFDPVPGSELTSTGLPNIDKAHLDADLYFQTADGKLQVLSSKSSINALVSEIDDSLLKPGPDSSQIGRQTDWRLNETPNAPRGLGFNAKDDGLRFEALLGDQKLSVIKDAVGHPDERSITLGDRRYSPNELDRFEAAAKQALSTHVNEARQAALAAGEPAPRFGQLYTEFIKDKMSSPDAAMKSFGLNLGEPVPPPRPATGFDMPTAKQGGLIGGAASLGVSSVIAASDGRISRVEAAQIERDTAVGALAGAATAAGERAVAPMIDRAVGRSVQSSAERLAVNRLGQSAITASTTGAVARTVVTRALGSTAVGAVVATGISAVENREGLAKGDSRAIGNVAADATVALGSIAAATATGAAIGSVVPVAGTAVGAVVGLAVGVGVAYGAQVSGARDWVADKVSGATDWVKSWF